MIKCEFAYTGDLLKQITKASTKVSNIISEIMLGIIVIADVALFATRQISAGVVFVVIAVLTLLAQILTNIRINKANSFLLNQKVSLQFDVKSMKYVQKLDKVILQDADIEYSVFSKVKQVDDFLFLYFNSRSALIVPRTAFKSFEDYQKAVDLTSNNYVA